MKTYVQQRSGYRITAAIGVAFIAAPLVMQMWTRAPKGAEMMSDFKPFMKPAVIERFQGYMSGIDASWNEIAERLDVLGASGEFQQVDRFRREWPQIHTRMVPNMLDVMGDQLDNFEAISSLPPFSVFPFAFTGLGLVLLALSLSAHRSLKKTGAATWQRASLIGLGIALVIGPLAVGMPRKASLGQQMMGSMGGMMTRERLADMQNSFLVLGATEGQLRLDVRGELGEAEFQRKLPATADMLDTWPAMSFEMAPMMGAMADNLDNFAALKAMPPFDLMPWFFIAPGVLLIVLGLRSGPRRLGTAAAPAVLKVQPRKEG